MGRKVMLIGVAIVAAIGAFLLCVIFFGVGFTERTAEKNIAGKGLSKIATLTRKSRFEELRKKKQIQSLLLAQRQRGMVDSPEPDIIDENLEYKKKRRKAVSPYYWDFAPKILDETVESQTRDLSYTEDLTERINTALSQGTYKGTTLDELVCGENLCRAKLSHEDNEAFGEFQRTSSNLGPWGSDLLGEGNGSKEDSTKSILYFAKDGFTQEPFEEMRETMYQKVLNKEIP